MSTRTPLLSITPLTLNSIPTAEELLGAAKPLLDEVAGWKKGKLIGSVQTQYRAKQKGDGAPWHSRLSTHTKEELSFEAFWKGLGPRGQHEPQYVHEIKAATCLRQLEDPRMSIWSMLYVFPAPFQPRIFTALIAVFPPKLASPGHATAPSAGAESYDDEFILVQVPIDVSSDAELAKANTHPEMNIVKHDNIVHGRYAATERVRKTQDGKTEWLMATSSNAGGNIPQFVQDMSIPSSIASDVPRFMAWAKTQPFANDAPARMPEADVQ
ncbi:hypothetical protein BKA62DRAFT_695196 [Auriculariales sp. MPI-PUGE-AT-0066]|nr:hypothetical protein BKA62DRAFT_695196 [Auriculariales sp. MPI-PUGE-AT-0066]